MKIKKGDQMKVLRGKDRGKTGPVLKVFPESGRILVEGVNVYKKRVRPKRRGEKGETVLVPRPIAASNAMLVCKNCGKPTRPGFRLEGGAKNRYCKKCRATI